VRYDRDLPNLCRDKGKFLDPEAGGNNYLEMLASTNIYQTRWHYIPEKGNLQTTCLKLFECVEDKDKTEAQASYKGIKKVKLFLLQAYVA
jgi:hypothetical protein